MYRILLMSLIPLAAIAQPVPGGRPPQPAQAESVKPEDLCTMEGKVVNAASGEPLRNAWLRVSPSEARPEQGPPASYSTSTDEAGRFAMKNLEPGRYRVSVSRNGFVTMQYGARRPAGPGTTLTLEKAARLTGVDFKLTPHGAVSGRILDEDGEPIQSVQVVLSQYTYRQGKRQLAVMASAVSNDLGEYRVFGVPPGKYFLAAMAPSDLNFNSQDRSVKAPPEEDYILTYYPGAPDATTAMAVDVPAGGVTSGLQLKMLRARTYRVSGHVTQTVAVGRPPTFGASLMPRLDDGWAQEQSMRSRQLDAKGNFDFRGVPAGSYYLGANTIIEGKQYNTRTIIEVAGNMEKLSLTLTTGVTLAGNIRVDGQTTQPLNGLRVNLRQKDAGGLVFTQATVFKLKDDMSFTMDNISPDRYDVSLPLPDGFYVKSMRAGQTDVMAAGIILTGGANFALEIVVSPNAGQVSGLVKNPDTDQPAPGVTVALVPKDKERREQPALYKNASTDQYGRFTLRNLTPGEYQVFAWEEVENSAWMDPDFLRPMESKAAAVTVQESGSANVEVTMIPAASAKK